MTTTHKSDVPPSIYERVPHLQDEAAFYNKDPILQLLQRYYGPQQDSKDAGTTSRTSSSAAPSSLRVLEIASGSGQHALFFSQNIPSFASIQPTEYDAAMLPVIANVASPAIAAGRVLSPLQLDVMSPAAWEEAVSPTHSLLYGATASSSGSGDVPASSGKGTTATTTAVFDVVLVTNLCHISPEATTVALMHGVAKVLKSGGRCFIYGPFLKDGKFTTESNARFDLWLKAKDPRFGLRDIEWVSSIAADQLRLIEVAEMPENNFTLVYERSI
jgi:SAM-dependent methyltransferase